MALYLITGRHLTQQLLEAPPAVLDINRQGMAGYGFSPPTRVFEAAGARPLADRVFRPLLAAGRREAA